MNITDKYPYFPTYAVIAQAASDANNAIFTRHNDSGREEINAYHIIDNHVVGHAYAPESYNSWCLTPEVHDQPHTSWFVESTITEPLDQPLTYDYQSDALRLQTFYHAAERIRNTLMWDKIKLPGRIALVLYGAGEGVVESAYLRADITAESIEVGVVPGLDEVERDLD